MDLYRKIAISFFVLSIFLLLAVFYVSFSWATIILKPRPTQISQNYTFDGLQNGAVGQDQLGVKIIEKDLEGEGSFPATKQDLPPKPAEKVSRVKGAITVVNTSSKPQPLRATTRFLNPAGVLFRSTEFVTVPAGGQASVSVTADKEGDLGEIDDSKFTLPGLWPGLQDKIYGKGLVTESADSPSSSGIVTRDDIQKGVAAISERLEEKMKTMIMTGNDIGDVVQPKIDTDLQVISVAPEHPVGTRTDQFSIRVKVKATAVVYGLADMREKIKKKLANSVGPGYEALPPDAKDITTEIETFDKRAGTARLKTSVQAGKIRTADASNFDKSKLAGKSATAIAGYFASFDDIIDTEVRFYPFWVTRAPFLVDHITILMKKE